MKTVALPTAGSCTKPLEAVARLRVLVVDDEESFRSLLSTGLAEEGFEVTTAPNAESALVVLSQRKFDVVLTDMRMPGLSGVGVVAAIREADPEVEVVVMTADASVETAVGAVRHGAYDYIEKPFKMTDLVSVLKRAYETGSLRAMVALYEVSRDMLGDLSGPDSISRILELSGRVLRVDAVRLALVRPEDSELEVHPRGVPSGPSSRMVLEVSREALDRTGPEPWSAPRLLAGMAEDDLHSALPYTLSVQGRTVGVLSFWRRGGKPPFSMSELRRGAVVAAEAAMSLENVRLYDELRERMAELIQARDQLVQSEKHAATGRLAAGVAHEINTPVQFVGDSVQFLRDGFADLIHLVNEYRRLVAESAQGSMKEGLLQQVRRAEEVADLDYLSKQIPGAIERSLEGISRVAEIVRAMKDFAHPDRREKSPANLNRALQGTIIVAHNELKYVAEVETDFGELPAVSCHVGDLNQVFLNLLVNAGHAIASAVRDTGAPKGTVKVRTRTDGDHVVIEIADNGCGIPEADRTHVFEPFFTTKDVGEGTGQGLAIARSVVVERHGGTLTFVSELGKGTTFFVRLPVTDPSEVR